VGNGHQEARAAFSVGSGPVRSETTDSGRVRAASGAGGAGSEDRFGRMLGRSSAMQVVFDVLGKAAPSDATILLEGETGTGKEVSAEAIHLGSPRKD
jgi:DNA-binding NtrC family response regulator